MNLSDYVNNKILAPYLNGLCMNTFYSTNCDYFKKKVVYTCLTGGYDFLLMQQYLDYSYDYVCFTDNENLLKAERVNAWKIKPLAFSELDNTRNSRWHKTHPHILFPDYDESIWIDSNIILKSSYFYDIAAKKNKNILIPVHYCRDCIYEEANSVLKAKKEDLKSVEKIIDYIKSKSFPHHYGLNETNVIYRKHNNTEVKEIMEEWWSFIRNFTKRDQLSLSYVLWKNNIKIEDISMPNLRFKYGDTAMLKHVMNNSIINVGGGGYNCVVVLPYRNNHYATKKEAA